MGLLELLKNYKKFDKDPNLLILGLDNAGKTTLLHNITQEKVTTTEPTKGMNIKTIIQEGFTINVWDIGGQKEIRQYWSAYYDNVDALLYVVDSADEERIGECNDQLKILMKEEKLELNDITDRDWSLYACSALKGFGIMEGLKWLIEKIASKK